MSPKTSPIALIISLNEFCEDVLEFISIFFEERKFYSPQTINQIEPSKEDIQRQLKY